MWLLGSCARWCGCRDLTWAAQVQWDSGKSLLPSEPASPGTLEMKVLCELPRASAGTGLPSSLDHGQHQRHQLLLYGGVCRWRVLGLQDDLMGLPEEILPHCGLHTLVPCSQLGSTFEDLAASAHRLQGEREQDGGGWVRSRMAASARFGGPRAPEGASTHKPGSWPGGGSVSKTSETTQGPPCLAGHPVHSTHMHQLCDGHQVSH